MSTQYPQVTIPNTEVRMFSSSIVNQEFKIFIALPPNYTESKKSYPVLYVLDANMFFGMVTETVRMLEMVQEIPEMIIIGIGYPISDFRQTFAIRARDLTPSIDDEFIKKWLEGVSKHLDIPLEFQGTGGGSDFLKFIREEMIPFVHSNYRTNPENNVIFGHSLGGLFALYTLFHHPNTFKRYIIGSPAMYWDNKIMLTHEAKYAATHTDLPARVFLSVGSLEGSEGNSHIIDIIKDIQILTKTLQDRGYDNLELKMHFFEGETHYSVIPATIS
ncbi:MAG: prolyl oligopeptidase family serine peptidase, partial [Methanosarcinaceae archaeon]|nr:prolyl oligopeptidase family serine peptidase [Methanosarcinaceae archaeon]